MQIELIVSIVLITILASLCMVIALRNRSDENDVFVSEQLHINTAPFEIANILEFERIIRDIEQNSNQLIYQFEGHIQHIQGHLENLRDVDLQQIETSSLLSADHELTATWSNLEFLESLSENGIQVALIFAFRKLFGASVRLDFSINPIFSEVSNRQFTTSFFKVLLDLFRFLKEMAVSDEVQLNV